MARSTASGYSTGSFLVPMFPDEPAMTTAASAALRTISNDTCSTLSTVDDSSAFDAVDQVVDSILGAKVYVINVGDRVFRVPEQTLRRESGSVLDRLFDGSRRLPHGSYSLGFDPDTMCEESERGRHASCCCCRAREQRVYLDCDATAFEHVLHWLRSGEVSNDLTEREHDRLRVTARSLGLKQLLARLHELHQQQRQPPEGTRHFTADQIAARVRVSSAAGNKSSYSINLKKADLTGEWLSGLDLRNAKLADAVLNGADCSGANLEYTDLTGVRAHNADLSHVQAREAVLHGASLIASSLDGASFKKANLSHTDLNNITANKTDFSEASFKHSDLRLANVDHSQMTQAEFEGAQMPIAGMSHVDLTCAKLASLDLSGRRFDHCKFDRASLVSCSLAASDLSSSDLRCADLTKALVQGTVLPRDLSGAKVCGVDLSTHDLTDMKLGHCVFDLETVLPHSLVGVDLSFTNLSQRDMSGWNLERANLSFCTLKDSNLSNARLEGATLPDYMDSVNLSGVVLTGRVLTSVSINHSNLSRVALNNATLTHAHLKHVDLTMSDLRGAKLTAANLEHCNLMGAQLDDTTVMAHASLVSCVLTNVDLPNDLEGVNLTNVDLSHKDLSRCHMVGANLSYCNLTGTLLPLNLERVNLTGVSLAGRDLSHANLVGANLTNVDITDTLLPPNLESANLTGINLANRDLTNANLTKCNLTFANLRGAILNKANLSESILEDATLAKASLHDADLALANLLNTDLQETDLTNAIISQADVEGCRNIESACFTGVRGMPANIAIKCFVCRSAGENLRVARDEGNDSRSIGHLRAVCNRHRNHTDFASHILKLF